MTTSPQTTHAAATPLPAHAPSRIHTPQTATTHYVSEFTLSPKGCSLPEAFGYALGVLQSWTKRKTSMPNYAVRMEQNGGDTNAPEAWAMHIQHGEPSYEYRRYWYTDVSLCKRPGFYDVRVSVAHSLDFGFVGWAPTPPDPSAPNFVYDWLGHPNLSLRSGQFPVAMLAPDQTGIRQRTKDRVNAMVVAPESADKLARLIFDPNRGLPVLLINGDVNPVTFPVDPNRLQQLLFSTCYVVWAPPAPGWSAAWRNHFPRGFECPQNSVRLYLTDASRTTPHDSKRHRFFSDDEIIEHDGSNAFIAMIRDGLTRRLLTPRPGRVATCEDVMSLQAIDAFNQQRARLNSKDEEIALYDSEYRRVLESKQMTDRLLQETEGDLARTKSELDALRPHVAELAAQLDAAKTSAPATFKHSDLLLRFLDGEASVADQLKAVQVIYGEAVHLLPSALASAENAEDFERPEALRDFLKKLVTDYRQALIDGKGTQEGARIFGRKDFTTKEADNLSQEGRRKRTFRYKGEDIFMEQHLKIGVKDSEAHCLRVHFHWDAAAKKIVIGHCGKHLPL